MQNELYETLQAIRGSHHYNAWIFSQFQHVLKPGQVILDVGSGTGNVIEVFSKTEFQKLILTDIDPLMLSELRQRFSGLTKYDVLELDFNDPHAVRNSGLAKADLVSCINVLEHIEDDLSALKNMCDALKDQGRLLLMVPAFQWLFGGVDRMAGHFRRYEMSKLRQLLQKVGFEIESQKYMNFFGVFTWYVWGRLLRQTHLERRTLGGLDHLVPLLERIENRIRIPFGQSIVMVCRKSK